MQNTAPLGDAAAVHNSSCFDEKKPAVLTVLGSAIASAGGGAGNVFPERLAARALQAAPIPPIGVSIGMSLAVGSHPVLSAARSAGAGCAAHLLQPACLQPLFMQGTHEAAEPQPWTLPPRSSAHATISTAPSCGAALLSSFAPPELMLPSAAAAAAPTLPVHNDEPHVRVLSGPLLRQPQQLALCPRCPSAPILGGSQHILQPSKPVTNKHSEDVKILKLKVSNLVATNQELKQAQQALQEQRVALSAQLSGLSTRLQRLQQCNLTIRSDNEFLFTTATAMHTLLMHHRGVTSSHDNCQLQVPPQLQLVAPQQADAGPVDGDHQQELMLERLMQQLQAQHDELQQLLVAFGADRPSPKCLV